MRTVRQRILEQIRAKGRVSTVELSRALRMGPANVRHHLSILLDEGVVELAGRLPSQGRGRPTNLYSESVHARQNNLGVLAGALLDEHLGGAEGGERSAALKMIAERMCGGVEPAGMSLTQRLHRAVRHLNEQHYEARWEAHTEAPHLIFGHCPFAAILPDHPELCLIDAFQLEALLDQPVLQKAKLARDSRGGTYCLFVLGKRV